MENQVVDLYSLLTSIALPLTVLGGIWRMWIHPFNQWKKETNEKLLRLEIADKAKGDAIMSIGSKLDAMKDNIDRMDKSFTEDMNKIENSVALLAAEIKSIRVEMVKRGAD